MRGFALANGYESVLGKESFDSNLEKRTWGYSDEDLYNKAIELIETKREKPLFLTIMTLSSHEPFDYPRGKVTPYQKAPLAGFANAIKYADFALGKFVATLKKRKLLENSVVAFIADHNNHPYGKFDVPIDRYKIPALILSPEYHNGGKVYTHIASQIDFAPTILDVAGISAVIPTMGVSVLQIQRDSAMLLARKENFAYLLKDKFVIFKRKAKTATYDYTYTPLPNNKEDITMGLSYIVSARYLYQNRLYTPPSTPSKLTK